MSRGPRYTYFFQDYVDRAKRWVSWSSFELLGRATVVGGVVGALGWAAIDIGKSLQETTPIAKRSRIFQRFVPIKLIERIEDPNSPIVIYRFALPNAADYAGYDTVSSVQLVTPEIKTMLSIARYYTPISHAEQRGVIEFAIKKCEPGRMNGRLRHLRPGDTMYLGKWKKEFRYYPNTYDKIGVVISTGGLSVALQLLTTIVHNAADMTSVSVLFCNRSIDEVPRGRLEEMVLQRPGRINLSHCIQRTSTRQTPKLPKELDGMPVYGGLMDEEMFRKVMPPPVERVIDYQTGKARAARNHILVCTCPSLMNHLCGRSWTLWNRWYVQGLWFQWHGFMPTLGYRKSQVYKFGTSTHYLDPY